MKRSSSVRCSSRRSRLAAVLLTAAAALAIDHFAISTHVPGSAAVHGHMPAGRDHRRARRRALVHRGERQQDRPDHDAAARSPSSRPDFAGRQAGRDHRRPRRALWFTRVRPEQDRRDNDRGRPSPSSRAPSRARRRHRRSGPDGRSGSPSSTRQPDRPDDDRRDCHRDRVPTGATPATSLSGPDSRLWFTQGLGGKIGAITDERNGQRSSVTTLRAAGERPVGHHVVGRAPCGSPRFGANQVGRISHHRRDRAHRPPAGAGPSGIATGSDGALWFTETGAEQDRPHDDRRRAHQRVRDPVAGAQPGGIAAGPDGALWFTESRRQQDRPHRDLARAPCRGGSVAAPAASASDFRRRRSARCRSCAA